MTAFRLFFLSLAHQRWLHHWLTYLISRSLMELSPTTGNWQWLHPSSRKAMSSTLLTIVQSLFFLQFQKFLRVLFSTNYMIIWKDINFFRKINMASVNATPQIMHAALLPPIFCQPKIRSSVLELFLYISKAFDTVDHRRLLTKLEFYGLDCLSLLWFENYLLNRRLIIVCQKERHRSEFVCHRGIPQGSKLGPLLFITYTCDLPDTVSSRKLLLYADDTCMYLHFSSLR